MKMPSKVLLIDDEAPLLLGLSTIMKRNGYEVLTAKNGAEGLSLARNEKPDVIISDVMMPSPNGFEFRDILIKIGKLRPYHSSSLLPWLKKKIRSEGLSAGLMTILQSHLTGKN